MAGLDVTPDQIATARSAGYSDQEIVSHLSSKAPQQFDTALKAGYTPTEILQHLAPQPSSTMDNLAQGGADALGGVGKTMQTYLGAGPVGNWMQEKAKQIAPADFVPSPIIDSKGFHPGGIIPTLARGAAPTAAAIGAGLLAPEAAGAAGAVGMGVGATALMNAGNSAQTAADNAAGTPNAPMTNAARLRGGLTSVAEALPQAVPLGRYLAPAAPLAKSGVAGALKTLAGTATDQGIASGASNVIGQVGQSVGTPGGVTVDPTQAANAAAGGVATGGMFGATKAARTLADAATYHGITPDLRDAATQFANLVQDKADGRNLDVGLGRAGAAQTAGNDAVGKATDAVNNNLKTAAADLRTRVPLTGAPGDILDAAMSGKRPTPGQYATLDAAIQGDPQGSNVMNLLRMSHVADIVRSTGYTSGDKFKGGISGSMGNILTGHNIEKSAIAGIGGAALEGGAGHLIAYSPIALGAAAGMSALGRLADNLTGARGPAGRFVRNFGDGSGAPTMQVAPQAPVVPPAPYTPPPVAGGSIITPNVRAAMNAQVNLAKLKAANNAPSVMSPAAKQQAIQQSIPLLRQLAAQSGPNAMARNAMPLLRQLAAIKGPNAPPVDLPANFAGGLPSAPQAAPVAPPAPAAPAMRGAVPADVLSNARAIVSGLRTTAKMQAAGRGQNAATSEVNASPFIQQLVGGAQNIPTPEASAAMAKAVSGARVLARLRSDPEAEAEEAATVKAQATAAKAAAKGTSVAQGVAAAQEAHSVAPHTVSKANGTTQVNDEPFPASSYAHLPSDVAASAITNAAGPLVKYATGYRQGVKNRIEGERAAMRQVGAVHPELPIGQLTARLEGTPNQTQAQAFRDHMKALYPHAAAALDQHLSDGAIKSLWRKKGS